jgi:hypothetical protein
LFMCSMIFFITETSYFSYNKICKRKYDVALRRLKVEIVYKNI